MSDETITLLSSSSSSPVASPAEEPREQQRPRGAAAKRCRGSVPAAHTQQAKKRRTQAPHATLDQLFAVQAATQERQERQERQLGDAHAAVIVLDDDRAAGGDSRATDDERTQDPFGGEEDACEEAAAVEEEMVEVPMTPEDTVIAEDSRDDEDAKRARWAALKTQAGKAPTKTEKSAPATPSLMERLRRATQEQEQRRQRAVAAEAAYRDSTQGRSAMDAISIDDDDDEAGAAGIWTTPRACSVSGYHNDASAFKSHALAGTFAQFDSSGGSSSSQRAPPRTTAAGAAARRAKQARKATKTAAAPTVGSKEFAMLSEEQQAVLRHALDGDSFFFTGAAGTGKSFLLRCIISALKDKHGTESVFVTASTGIAACNISGTTLHSFAAIGLGKGNANELLRRVRTKGEGTKRWRRCQVLIVDEVSMISGELFDKIEFVARRIRSSERPFGGIQVILCGDFFQLPPVFDQDEHEHKYCFEAACWAAVVPRSFMLKQVFRQKDERFVRILSEVRMGTISQDTLDTLRSRVCSSWTSSERPSGAGEPTRLLPFRASVEDINMRRLEALGGESRTFEAADEADSPVFARLLDQVNAPQRLVLRVGAQVILLKNLDFERELVNGSLGVVVGFGSRHLPVVRFRNGEEVTVDHAEWAFELGGKKVASRVQIPLSLAWALSIHKSQGMTLTDVEMSIERVFAEGQAYVALSRVTSLAGLRIVGRLPPPASMRPNPRVVEFYKTFS